MDILLAAVLAKAVLPGIDRASLERQARAEAGFSTNVTPPPRPVAYRAQSSATLDLASVTSICRAASRHEDPAGFIARLSRAYQLGANERLSLRASCAAYRAGLSDAEPTAGTH